MTVTYAHLLIAGPDGPARDTLLSLLDQWGLYAITTAPDARQALDLAGQQIFDLILLDLNLVMADDCAILRALRDDHLQAGVPVLILAEASALAQVSRCIEEGATDYLLTPVDPILLQARLGASLGKRHLHEQIHSLLESFNEVEKLADDLRTVILPLGIALSAERDFDRLLERIVVEAKKVCHADAGTLYLRTGDDHLAFAITHTDSLQIAYGGTTGRVVPYDPLPLYDGDGAPNHKNVATYVALNAESIAVDDVYHADRFDFSGTRAFDRRNNYRSVSCLTVPLQNHDIIGVLQLLNAQDKAGEVIPFTLYHQLVAESLASQAAVVLHNRMLREEQQKLFEIRRELEIGRRIQAGFFPETLPQPAGWELVARFHPAREVAGDFYDAFTMPHGKIGLVIADVCDKGVGAALFMALVRSLLRAFIQQHYYLRNQNGGNDNPFRPVDTEALLDAILLANDYIVNYHSQNHMFATVFFGVLDPVSGELIYVNSGHNPPVIFDAAGMKTRLDPTGPAVGLWGDVTFDVGRARLAPGDTLLAFTDGVTEARNASGTFFSETRLLALVGEHADSAVALLDRIEDEVAAYVGPGELHDDITLMAMRREV